MKRILATLMMTALATGMARAAEPLQLSLTPDIALHKRDAVIEGVALSIWGENEQKALALGFVNGSNGNSVGLSWGLVNYAENYKGIQWSMVNFNRNDFAGWQSGFVNFNGGNLVGLQTGKINYTAELTGVQFGFINFARRVPTGVQIGLINVIQETQGWFDEFPEAVAPAMLFLNWRF